MDLQGTLAAAQAGDQDAFRALVEPYLPGAYRTTLLILLDRELARDAVQEALVRAYASLGHFRTDAPFRPWFSRIVVNEARRLWRRERRQPTLLEELPDLTSPGEDSPEALLPAQESRESLWQALAELDDLHRTVLVLRYYQGLSESEMAEVLETRPGTVKSRLHNAPPAAPGTAERRRCPAALLVRQGSSCHNREVFLRCWKVT
ncbi:MAG TPA: sigma-70 family RNA polymerase sigma factor [Symbiobacteriaceae bacterium]|nr:sigma-70 family RNA polymerase sigma factor [Symbiobacteriaceae bacterium]